MLSLATLALTAALQAGSPPPAEPASSPLQAADVDVSDTAHGVLASEPSGLAAEMAIGDPVALPEGVTTEDWASVREAYEAGGMRLSPSMGDTRRATRARL